MGGCISSVPSNDYSRRNMLHPQGPAGSDNMANHSSCENDVSRSPSFEMPRANANANAQLSAAKGVHRQVPDECDIDLKAVEQGEDKGHEGEGEGIIDVETLKLNAFIERYKLESISSFLFDEAITMDFLLSQNTESVQFMARQLIHDCNLIQQNKFIYAVAAEKQKQRIRRNHTDHGHNNSRHEHNNSHRHGEQLPAAEQACLYSSEELSQSLSAPRIVRVFIAIDDDDSSSASLPLFVPLSDRIVDVKHAYLQQHKSTLLSHTLISDATNLSPDSLWLNTRNMCLTYCGQPLQDDKALAFYNVVADSQLMLSYSYMVAAAPADCHPSQHHINHDKNKHKVRSKTHLRYRTRHRHCRHNKPKSSSTQEMSIADHPHHHHQQLKQQRRRTLRIFIQTQWTTQCLLALTVDSDIRVKRIKQKIEKKWGIRWHHQRLQCGEIELSDEAYIGSYDVDNDDTLYLTKQLGLYSVFVTVVKGDEVISIGVEKSDRIKSVKLQIHLHWSVPASQQRLLYLGKELTNDEQTIKSANICDGGIIYVV